ncbi:hypothetical protein [Streptomyces sp. NPDC059909]|uniref:hypothetical protein n=1 Tax=Streptomyces sp. NPDC059909 TaxID=3346998 RepID=UPI00365426EA
MTEWDFHEWQAALGAVDPQAAALVGLAAAERISGCLDDERFRRHGSSGAEVVRDLLQACWTNARAGDGSSLSRLRELADQLADWSSEYLTLSLTDLFHSYETLPEDGPEGDEGPDGGAADLDEFLEEAEPEGAVMMHLDALTAVSEAASACTGGPWDGALRCLQITAIAASRRDPLLPGPGIELQRQREDLALLGAAASTEPSRVAADLQARAQADARGWKQATEQIDLLHG